MRLASSIGYWMGAVLLIPGVPLMLMVLASSANLHHRDPKAGQLAFLMGCGSLVVGLIGTSASLVVGSFVWARRPWTVLAGVGILAAAFAVYALLFAGWLQGLF